MSNIVAMDLMAAFRSEPPELDFIWPGFLAGTVGALVAPGGTGKSFWALEAAMAVACGAEGGDALGLRPKQSGRVVYLSGEDPAAALTRRVHAIGQHLTQAAQEVIVKKLTLAPLVGTRLDLMDEVQLTDIMDYCTGARLLVLDTLSRVHYLDENSNGDMARLVSTLEYIAASTGAAVLFLHHVNKGSAREKQIDQQQAARGASALIDNVRWCGYITRMTEQEAECMNVGSRPVGKERRGYYVRVGESKQNYSDPEPDKWFERVDGGVLVASNVTMTDAATGCASAKKYTKKKEGDHEDWR